MQVIFLGTGSPRELDRANAAIAVRLTEHGRAAVDGPHDEAEGGAAETVLLDTAGGNEILRQLRAARIAPETIHHILISHQHFDHAAGLAILLLDLSRFPGEPIFVYVPAAGLEAIRTVIEVQCPGVISTRLGERLRFVPLDPGQSAQLALSDGSAARDGHAGPVTSDGAERRAGEHTAILTATDAVHPVPAIGCVL